MEVLQTSALPLGYAARPEITSGDRSERPENPHPHAGCQRPPSPSMRPPGGGAADGNRTRFTGSTIRPPSNCVPRRVRVVEEGGGVEPLRRFHLRLQPPWDPGAQARRETADRDADELCTVDRGDSGGHPGGSFGDGGGTGPLGAQRGAPRWEGEASLGQEDPQAASDGGQAGPPAARSPPCPATRPGRPGGGGRRVGSRGGPGTTHPSRGRRRGSARRHRSPNHESADGRYAGGAARRRFEGEPAQSTLRASQGRRRRLRPVNLAEPAAWPLRPQRASA